MRSFRSFLKRFTLSVPAVALGTGVSFAAPVHIDTHTGQHATQLVTNDTAVTPVSFPMAGHHTLDFDPLGAIDRHNGRLQTVARIDYWRSGGTVMKSAILQAKDGKITSTLAGVRWRQNPMPEVQHSDDIGTPQAHEGFIQLVLRWRGDIRDVDDVPGLFNGYYSQPAVIKCANGDVFNLVEVGAIQPLLNKELQPEKVALSIGSETVNVKSFGNGIFWHASPIPTIGQDDETQQIEANHGFAQPALGWGDLGAETGNVRAAHSGYSHPVNDQTCNNDPLYFISLDDLPEYRTTFPLGNGNAGPEPFSPFGTPFSAVPLPNSALLMLSAFAALLFGRRRKTNLS